MMMRIHPQGEIETLILNDVTGDAYQYGVITRYDEEGGTMIRMRPPSDSALSYQPVTSPPLSARARLDR